MAIIRSLERDIKLVNAAADILVAEKRSGRRKNLAIYKVAGVPTPSETHEGINQTNRDALLLIPALIVATKRYIFN